MRPQCRLILSGIAFMGILVTGVLLIAILSATLPDGDTPPVFQGSDTYEGLGDTMEAANANLRRATKNAYINSTTVKKFTQKCKINIAALYGEDYLSSSRIGGGPLSSMQLSTTHAIFSVYDTRSIAGAFLSKLIGVNRKTCAIDWISNITDVSTHAARILLNKFPTEYDAAAVASFERPASDAVCFGPISVYKDYVFTGTGCTGRHFFTDEYYASRPQANGGPILGHTWGITNAERHWMNGHVYVLNAKTGELLDADRLADSGEFEAQGYCNIETLTRMPQVSKDSDGSMYVFYGASHPFRAGKYTRIDGNETRFNIGVMNGNREVRKGGVVKRFQVHNGGKLEETWRLYGSPTMLFAGDVNPYNTSQIFATDDEAEQRNYHNDGVWPIQMIDLERRQILVSGGNGLFMPAEDILAAFTAVGTLDPATGGQGYPSRTFLDWTLEYGAADSFNELQETHYDFVQSQVDRVNAINALPGSRRDQFFANALAIVDYDTGITKSIYIRSATDTWISLTFQHLSFASLDPYPYQKAQFLGGGGDQDYPMGVLNVKSAVKGGDRYVVAAKDGSVQSFDADTFTLIASTKIIPGGVAGGFNYGGTVDHQGHVHFSGAWRLALEFLSDLGHITTYNATTKQITVVPNLECLPPSSPDPVCIPANTPMFSNAFVDTYGELGNGVEKLYLNQDAIVPDHAGVYVKLDPATLSVASMATRESVQERSRFFVGHALPTSVNDVVISATANGRIEIWDPVTMTRLWYVNLLPDVAGLPGHPGNLSCDTGVAVAGKEMWFACGGGGFSGEGPGAFVYAYTL